MNNPNTTQKGLVVIFTGDGKGKTSAAMGVMTRATGHEMTVEVIQFLKNPGRVYGEALSAAKLGVPFNTLGKGFVFNPDQGGDDKQAALDAWETAKEFILSHENGVLILDEFTYPLIFGWIEVNAVVDWLKAHKPAQLHIVMTGRSAPDALVAYADMVTEMREIKHPFRLQQIPAQRGIDF